MSSKVCMWDAFGDFACTRASASAPSSGKAAVPGFSPAGAFGADGAAVTFETFAEEQKHPMHPMHPMQKVQQQKEQKEQKEGFSACGCGAQ